MQGFAEEDRVFLQTLFLENETKTGKNNSKQRLAINL